MSSVDRLASGFKAQLSSKFVKSIVGGIITVVLARLLTTTEYGLFFLALSVFALVKVFTRLGFARSAGRYIADYKETDPTQIPHIILTAFVVNTVTICIAVIVFVVGHQTIAELINQPAVAPLLLFGTLYVAFSTYASFLTKVWQGFEEIRLASMITICSQSGRLLFSIGFVLLGYGAMGALGGYILANMIAVGVGAVILYKNYYIAQEAASVVESGLRRRIVEYSLPITATNTADRIDKQFDTILVGFFLTPVAVGYYVVGKQVIQFVETPMSALGFTLAPTFGAEKADGNIERASRIYETALSHILLLYIPGSVGIILIAEPFISLFFGSDYLGAVPVLQVLGVFAVLKAVTKLSGNGLDYLGRARSRAIAKTGTAALNVGLNILLIPTLGVVGAAVSTVLTYGLYTAATLYIVSQEFTLNARRLAGQLLKIGLITAGMSAAVMVLLDQVQGIVTLFVVVGVGLLVWMVLSTLSGLLDLRRIVSILS